MSCAQTQAIQCPECQSDETVSRTVDYRAQYRCLRCRNRWYGDRGWTNSAYSVLDEIADAVALRGQAEELTIVLLTYVRRDELWTYLDDWCQAHGFACTKFGRRRPYSLQTEEQFLRFAWAKEPDEDLEPPAPLSLFSASKENDPFMNEQYSPWADFTGWLHHLLQSQQPSANVWQWPWTRPADQEELELSYRRMEYGYSSEILAAVDQLRASCQMPWEAVRPQVSALLSVRLGVAAWFCWECSISSARELIPFPELPYQELLAWLLSDWWQEHGVEKAFRLWIAHHGESANG